MANRLITSRTSIGFLGPNARTEHRRDEDDHSRHAGPSAARWFCPPASPGKTTGAPCDLPASSPAMSAKTRSLSSGPKRRRFRSTVSSPSSSNGRANIDGVPQLCDGKSALGCLAPVIFRSHGTPKDTACASSSNPPCARGSLRPPRGPPRKSRSRFQISGSQMAA